MNSIEIKLFDFLIGEDVSLQNRALAKLFFCQPGETMSRFQKAAQDGILRKFSGDKYKAFSVREKYCTAMECVQGTLIDILRKEKAKFFKNDLHTIGEHWTDKYINMASFLGTVVEREANKRRKQIDALLGLEEIEKIEIKVSTNSGLSEGEDVEDSRLDYNRIILEAISNLKSDRDKQLLIEIGINNVSEEEYSIIHNVNIDGLYRDFARARSRLIIEMLPIIRKKMRTVVNRYSYCLNDSEANLLNDVIVKGYNIRNVAIARSLRASDVESKFSAAYKKLLKEYVGQLDRDKKTNKKREEKLEQKYNKYIETLTELGVDEDRIKI